MKLKMMLALVFSTVLLISCSSGGGSDDDDDNNGSTPDGATVEVTAKNASKLATAATEGLKQASNSDNLPTPRAKAKSLDLASTVSTLPCSDFGWGGSGNVVSDFNDNSYTITYDCEQFSGTVRSSYTPDIQNWITFTTVWDDFVVNGFGFGSQSLDGEVTCTRADTTSTTGFSCTYGYTGIDGLDGGTYSVSNVDVSGNNSSGYSVSATVNAPGTGAVTFSASGVTFNNCTYGVPSSGSMTISGINDTEILVNYDSCDSFTVTLDGVATTYDWVDLAA